MKESILYVNDGPTKIFVEITPNTIENYAELLGKKRIIKTCKLSDIVRVVKDISLLENKTKLTIYYRDREKEKRFGGLGFSIEGNLLDNNFIDLIKFLETHLPSNAIWEDKAIKKASTTTEEGLQKFPTAGNFNLLLYKYPSHAGERSMIIAVRMVLAFGSILFGMTLLTLALFQNSDMLTSLFFAVLSTLFLAYGFFILNIAFKKGGLQAVFIGNDFLRLNTAFKSIDIPFETIKKIDYKIRQLSIRQNANTTKSIEYIFSINETLNFTIGENSALSFINKLTEHNLPIQIDTPQ